MSAMKALAAATHTYARPTRPAAMCLHLIRQCHHITRPELVAATGLSQSTIARATAALIRDGFIEERPDHVRRPRRGRPTIPLQLRHGGPLYAGVAIGTTATYVAFYDLRGRTVASTSVDISVARTSPQDLLEHIIAAINRLNTGVGRPLASVGVTTSGHVSDHGVVTAANLGWEKVDFSAALRYHFDVPVSVTGAVPAILGAEMHTGALPPKGTRVAPTLALFADDSVSAAISGADAVRQIATLPAPQGRLLPTAGRSSEDCLSTRGFLGLLRERGFSSATLTGAVRAGTRDARVRELLDERALLLADAAGALARSHGAGTIVLAGSAFSQDQRAPRVFARRIAATGPGRLSLRMIPAHRDIVHTIARAVALDSVLRVPEDLPPVRVAQDAEASGRARTVRAA